MATRILSAIAGERRAVTLGWGNHVAFWTGRHLPWLVDWAFAHRQLREPAAIAAADTAPAARIVLITGAADGIGYALAQHFSVDDYTITGLDIDETRAQTVQQSLQAAGGTATFLIGNLAEPADQTRFSAALTTGPALTVAIHNAGINAVGAFSASDLERQRQVLAVNLTAPLILTAALLNGQKLPRGSTLVFISSLSYFVSYPGAAVYAASKAGLAAYARSLALALAAAGIHVLAVFLGPTRTAHACRYSPDNRREEQRMTPDQVAAFVHQAVHRQQWQLIPGALNRLFAIGGRVAPLLFEQVMRRTLFEKLVAAQGETDE